MHQGYGKYHDFCSLECRNIGRAYCKQCGVALPHDNKHRRDFCDNRGLCQRIYYQGVQSVSPMLLEERKRSTCKVCGTPITQPKSGVRFFCKPLCRLRYHRAEKQKQDLLQRWGGYAPETRKVLLEIEEQLQSPRVANRMADAIAREYVLRYRDDPKNIRGSYISCRCKRCGVEFRRRSWGHQSKDYCDKCLPLTKGNQGEKNINAKLTWDQATEIRTLYATEHLSHQKLAEKFGVTPSNISMIVRNMAWKPEHDPRSLEQGNISRRGSGENHAKAKLTWEQVDEIRRLHKTEHLGYRVLAKQYGVAASTIRSITDYRIWKPEHDPRRKS